MNGMLTAAIVVTVVLVAVIVVLWLKYRDLKTQTDIAKKDLQERESIMQKEALIKAKEALHNSGIILTDYRTMISGKLPSTYGELKDDGEYERVYQTVSEKGDSLLKAYAESYDEIIKGHSEGSRETYIADESSENGFRKQTADEELSELDKAYDQLSSEFESDNSKKIISALSEHAKLVKEASAGRAKIASSSADALSERKAQLSKLPTDLRQKLIDASNSFKSQYSQKTDGIDVGSILKGISIFGSGVNSKSSDA